MLELLNVEYDKLDDPAVTNSSGSSSAAVIDAKLFNICPTAGIEKFQLSATRRRPPADQAEWISQIGRALRCHLFVRFEIGAFGLSALGWSD